MSSIITRNASLIPPLSALVKIIFSIILFIDLIYKIYQYFLLGLLCRSTKQFTIKLEKSKLYNYNYNIILTVLFICFTRKLLYWSTMHFVFSLYLYIVLILRNITLQFILTKKTFKQLTDLSINSWHHQQSKYHLYHASDLLKKF